MTDESVDLTPRGLWAVRHPLAFTATAAAGFIVLSGLGVGVGRAAGGAAGEQIGLGLGRLLIAFLAAAGLLLLAPSSRHLLLPPAAPTAWLQGILPLLLVAVVVPPLAGRGFGVYAVPPGTWAPEVATALAVGAAEEVLLRGLVLAVLLAAWAERRGGTWRAVLVSSAAFAVLHLPNVLVGEGVAITLGQTAAAFLLGVFACGVVLASGSVWPAAVAHAGFVVVFGRTLAGSEPGVLQAVLFVVVYLPLAVYGVLSVRRARRRHEGRPVHRAGSSKGVDERRVDDR
jgi:membrane protease YdiL (CAAX protease family)